MRLPRNISRQVFLSVLMSCFYSCYIWSLPLISAFNNANHVHDFHHKYLPVMIDSWKKELMWHLIKTGAHALMQFEYGIWLVTWFVIMLVKEGHFVYKCIFGNKHCFCAVNSLASLLSHYCYKSNHMLDTQNTFNKVLAVTFTKLQHSCIL